MLRAAAPRSETSAAAALRDTLMPAINPLLRRQRQQQRQLARAVNAPEAERTDACAEQPAQPVVAPAVEADSLQLQTPHLSRLLYPNPVCFLSSWAGGRRNLMTISWLTAVDNEGRFVLSMNQRRHTARRRRRG